MVFICITYNLPCLKHLVLIEVTSERILDKCKGYITLPSQTPHKRPNQQVPKIVKHITSRASDLNAA